MEGSSRKEGVCPQLLDLILKEREWHVKRGLEKNHEEKKLELRLGPPGEQDWPLKTERDKSVLSLRYFSSMVNNNQAQKFPPFRHFHQSQGLPAMGRESSQPCRSQAVDLQQRADKKAFSTASAAHTAVPNGNSQKRAAPSPVVGWPPVRSFRKNLACSSSSKAPASESRNALPAESVNEKPVETSARGMFVKINMDGVPIGRKVDLQAFDSYEKLSSAVDELFRGLLAAQRDSTAGGSQNKEEVERAITGLLDESGEYTLVYEDNEGDRMLVGDVPWHMFVSTVKRLRVLKSSEVSALSIRTKEGKVPRGSSMR